MEEGYFILNFVRENPEVNSSGFCMFLDGWRDGMEEKDAVFMVRALELAKERIWLYKPKSYGRRCGC